MTVLASVSCKVELGMTDVRAELDENQAKNVADMKDDVGDDRAGQECVSCLFQSSLYEGMKDVDSFEGMVALYLVDFMEMEWESLAKAAARAG